MKKEEIIRKVMKETGKSLKLATIMTDRIVMMRKELQPSVIAWLNGKQPDYTYKNITLKEIMEKENCSYIEAIFSMQVLMDKPHLAAQYKNLDFRRK